MRQIIDDAGTEYGWSEEETHKFFTSYMVAGRLKEKYEKARALKVEANKQTTPAAKAELFKQSREITDTLKLGMTEEECDAAREAYESVEGFVKAEKMWHKVRLERKSGCLYGCCLLYTYVSGYDGQDYVR
jgi:hypothetical protein